MPRDKKAKRNELPRATDLAEHCHHMTNYYENQFGKVFRGKAGGALVELVNYGILELIKGEYNNPPPIDDSKDLIKAQKMLLRYDQKGTSVESSNTTLGEVLRLIDSCPTEARYKDNYISFTNLFLGGIALHRVGNNSWLTGLLIMKNRDFLNAIDLEKVKPYMVKILTINFFNGDFVGNKYIGIRYDAKENKELIDKFLTVQEELQENGLNCSYCYSTVNVNELRDTRCQYCGNELIVFHQVLEIFN